MSGKDDDLLMEILQEEHERDSGVFDRLRTLYDLEDWMPVNIALVAREEHLKYHQARAAVRSLVRSGRLNQIAKRADGSRGNVYCLPDADDVSNSFHDHEMESG